MLYVCVTSLFVVLSNVLILLDTHALVQFMDKDCTAIVPVKRIEKKDTVEYNGLCNIKWNNNKTYHAFLLFSGMYALNLFYKSYGSCVWRLKYSENYCSHQCSLACMNFHNVHV